MRRRVSYLTSSAPALALCSSPDPDERSEPLRQAWLRRFVRLGEWLATTLMFATVVTILAAAVSGVASAKVFHARDEAIKLAFPDADRVETRDFFLTAEQRKEIEKLAKSPLETDLLTVYVGHRAGSVMGYALLDTHMVRTLPETFLIVLDPRGSVASLLLLAFYEPLEYAPGARWLAQSKGRSLEDDLEVGRGVAAITGSTLTTRAVMASVKRALAVYKVLIEKP